MNVVLEGGEAFLFLKDIGRGVAVQDVHDLFDHSFAGPESDPGKQLSATNSDLPANFCEPSAATSNGSQTRMPGHEPPSEFRPSRSSSVGRAD